MHPYTTQAIAVQRIADKQSEAAAERLARQARACRAAASPEAGSCLAGRVGGQQSRRHRLLARWVFGRALSA